MIKTVAELLNDLTKSEAAKLAQSKIKHTVTIGAMYEGLTKDILSRALPPNLGLKIVDGFVHDGFGEDSGQIDCMLVIGDGEPIPYVYGSFRWHVKDVIAVFEIKKTLFGNSLSEAFQQMQAITNCWSRYVQNISNNTLVNLKPTLRNYAQITGLIAPPANQWKNMPTGEHLILHSIMMDQLAPARIVYGYGGYKHETGLRKGFLDMLQNHTRTHGYGVPSLPNLITANGNSLVKLTGHPFSSPIVDEYWPIIGSTNTNAIELILEIIWTKLTYIQAMPELFGSDLELEVFNFLLSAKPQKAPENIAESWGWMYKSTEAPQKCLNECVRFTAWEPTVLTDKQNTILMKLCQGLDVNITDVGFIDFVESDGESTEEFVKELIATTLVATNKNCLELTTFECAMAILPDGRYIAGENNTGRLTRWINRFMETYGK